MNKIIAGLLNWPATYKSVGDTHISEVNKMVGTHELSLYLSSAEIFTFLIMNNFLFTL